MTMFDGARLFIEGQYRTPEKTESVVGWKRPPKRHSEMARAQPRLRLMPPWALSQGWALDLTSRMRSTAWVRPSMGSAFRAEMAHPCSVRCKDHRLARTRWMRKPVDVP
jgi:hypothetical protein